MSHKNTVPPIIAAVILIAITLIAAIAIAGFVFGLFGSFSQPAGVPRVAQPVLVTQSVCDGSLNCTFTIHNNMTNTMFVVMQATMIVEQVKFTSACQPILIPANQTESIQCTFRGPFNSTCLDCLAGFRATGEVTLESQNLASGTVQYIVEAGFNTTMIG